MRHIFKCFKNVIRHPKNHERCSRVVAFCCDCVIVDLVSHHSPAYDSRDMITACMESYPHYWPFVKEINRSLVTPHKVPVMRSFQVGQAVGGDLWRHSNEWSNPDMIMMNKFYAFIHCDHMGNKKVDVLQTVFSNAFTLRYCVHFDSDFTEICLRGAIS